MSAPRLVLPGTTYLITRRCTQRQFLLRPSEKTNQLLHYLLAVAAQRCGIQLHSYCILSNHLHFILTDPDARLPAFMQYFNELAARGLNFLLGHREALWAPNSYNAIPLAAPEDVLRKAVYVLANPVSAGLVRKAGEWPGLWSAPERVGGEALRVARPTFFFNQKGKMPKEVDLRLSIPPGFASAEEFRERLLDGLREREAEEDVPGRRFRGVAAVLAQDPMGSPPTQEERRPFTPKVTALSKDKRKALLKRLREFWNAYREAWEARRRGAFATVFPAGTYQMRVLFFAPCADSTLACALSG